MRLIIEAPRPKLRAGSPQLEFGRGEDVSRVDVPRVDEPATNEEDTSSRRPRSDSEDADVELADAVAISDDGSEPPVQRADSALNPFATTIQQSYVSPRRAWVFDGASFHRC